MVYVTGEQLKRMISYMLRDGVFAGEHCEFYQFSHGMEVEYDQATHSFLKFNLEGEPIDDEKVYTVGLQHYHFLNMQGSFGISLEEIEKNHKQRMVATSCTQVIEEALLSGQNQNAKGEGRLILHLM